MKINTEFNYQDNIIAIEANMFGKEVIYLNGEKVSEQRNISSNGRHLIQVDEEQDLKQEVKYYHSFDSFVLIFHTAYPIERQKVHRRNQKYYLEIKRKVPTKYLSRQFLDFVCTNVLVGLTIFQIDIFIFIVATVLCLSIFRLIIIINSISCKNVNHYRY